MYGFVLLHGKRTSTADLYMAVAKRLMCDFWINTKIGGVFWYVLPLKGFSFFSSTAFQKPCGLQSRTLVLQLLESSLPSSQPLLWGHPSETLRVGLTSLLLFPTVPGVLQSCWSPRYFLPEQAGPRSHTAVVVAVCTPFWLIINGLSTIGIKLVFPPMFRFSHLI